jgi:hypothetical protein
MPMLPRPDSVPFPIFLSLAGVVVAGGGAAALAKIRLHHRSGAALIVVDPAPHEEIAALSEAGTIELRRRAFVADDLADAKLCYIALDDADAAAAIVAEARRRGVLTNAVDRPALCDFMTPAIVERGPVTIAISTGGAPPAPAYRGGDSAGLWRAGRVLRPLARPRRQGARQAGDALPLLERGARGARCGCGPGGR